jgi:hypothetical protein
MGILISFTLISVIPATADSENSHNDSLNTNYPIGETRSTRNDKKPAQLEIDLTSKLSQIFVSGSGLNPNSTRVTVTVRGVGYPGVEYNPQDTVFVMDNSDSMDESDNEYKRVEALRIYLDTMLPPDDRAAIVKFSNNAELVKNHHLTSNYSQILSDLSELWHTTGLTNLEAAVATANQELIEYGDSENKTLVEILLTDGRPEPPENNVTMNTIKQAIDNNIKIYTIGLGDDHDAKLLRWIANLTGGKYYFASEASELIAIYNDISDQFHNYTAGSDPDPLDDDPLIRIVLPTWTKYVKGSFSIPPDYIGSYPGGSTKLEWNVSHIAIGETWTVSYNVTSTSAGEVEISVHTHSRVKYKTQAGIEKTLWFDKLAINVLPKSIRFVPGAPPPPPLPPTTFPVSGFPVPAATPAGQVPIIMQPAMPVSAGATTAAVPVEYLIGGFVGLGIAERLKQRRLVKSRQKVAIGV